MLGWAALECNFPAIDSYGPNQIPVFHNPQGCKAGLTKVLAQLPVAPGKNKGPLYDATGGALGGRQGGFVTGNLAVSHVSIFQFPLMCVRARARRAATSTKSAEGASSSTNPSVRAWVAGTRSAVNNSCVAAALPIKRVSR